MIRRRRVTPITRRRKPRVCGDAPRGGPGLYTPYHVNPACAGMIRGRGRHWVVGEGKPRVCGDDPQR